MLKMHIYFLHVTIFTLAAITDVGVGLTCLKCDSVPQPRLCNKVMECYEGESCSVQKILNEFGEHIYRLGCLSNKVCSGFTNTSQALTTTQSTCSECCSDNLCNAGGCGQPGYPQDRGLLCYNCPLHTDNGKCHDIDFCFQGEVCSVVGKNVFSNLVYTSKCISKHECKQNEESHAAIIGKRTLDTHQPHICDTCCSTDICNKNCSTALKANDPCLSNPCHHGSCFTDGNNFKCTCSAGYTGLFCENDIDECSLRPCLHGSCTDQVNGYRCSCFAGYTGLNCYTEIDECSIQPCVNGSCTDQLNGYKCTCVDGYTGVNCETDADSCASNPCGNGSCTDGVGAFSCTCNAGYGGRTCEHIVTDCFDLYHYDGKRTDGVYTIVTWKTRKSIQVYCDMTTDGGGWTVFQYRFNGSVDFYRNFYEYENGFGNLNTEFWLGLNNIQEIASQGQTDLRIDLEAANGTRAFEKFERFHLSPAPDYTLFLGNTIDSLRISQTYKLVPYHNGMKFTTYDHDVDLDSTENCAVRYHGAWWYNRCYNANLNGQYMIPGTEDDKSMNYQSFLYYPSLKSSKMMNRRRNVN